MGHNDERARGNADEGVRRRKVGVGMGDGGGRIVGTYKQPKTIETFGKCAWGVFHVFGVWESGPGQGCLSS